MYGLEAINVNNGWAISVVGITIVFSGLVSLAFVISQLYKVLEVWEDPSKIKALFKSKKQDDHPEEPGSPVSDTAAFSESQEQVAKQFALLVRTMEDHFSLSRLLHLAQISGLKDPHSNLNHLIKKNIIIPDGTGFFTWNKDRFDKLFS